MKNLLTIILLFGYTFLLAQKKSNFREECIAGNCRNGKGVLKTGLYTYRVGSFEKGELNGEGIHLEFFAPGAYNSYASKEADFVLQAGLKQMSPADALQFSPLNYKYGQFEKGKLQGHGKERISSLILLKEKFPGLLDEQLLGLNDIQYSVYEGSFIDNELTGKGSLTIEGTFFSIFYHPDQFDRILHNLSGMFEITDKKNSRKGYYNGIIKNGYRQGWFTTNIKEIKPGYGRAKAAYELVLDSGFYRVLYFDNEIIGRTATGIYPLDEAGSVQKDLGNNLSYFGPLNANGQPHGFGMLTRTVTDNKRQQQKQFTYTGYFLNGKKEGLGEQVLFYQSVPSGWLSGIYSTDTIVSGSIYHMSSVRYEIYGSKGKNQHPYTVYEFKKGRFTGTGLIKGYGTKGTFRKYHKDGKNFAESEYTGYFNEREEYHGQGHYTNKTDKNERKGNFVNGRLSTGSSKYRADGLWEGCVVASNGKKVYVVSKDPISKKVVLSDGSMAVGEYEIIGYDGAGFKCSCTDCGGDGRKSSTVSVPITSHSWTRDVQTSAAVPYLNARWEGITKVTTGYTTGGYSYTQQGFCDRCKGSGSVYCKNSLPL